MYRAWLTPDDLPASSVCWQVLVPESIEFEAVFRGALLLLQDASNWEKFGDQTAEDCAALWAELNETNLAMLEGDKCKVTNPIGTIIWGAWATAPDGYLLCDGDGYDVDDYPDLFNIINYDFGGSDGVFAVPDLRNMVSVGAGDLYSVGDSGGEAEHTNTIAETPVHNHPLQFQLTKGPGTGAENILKYVGFDASATGNAGSGDPHNNMQPFLALNAAIAYE